MSVNYLRQYKYVIIWALFILFACGASPGTLHELRLDDLFGYDKPIHAFLFGMQSWLIIKAWEKNLTHPKHSIVVLLSCLIGACYGALIELLQLSVFKGRTYDYYDMIANTFGCLVVWIWLTIKAKR